MSEYKLKKSVLTKDIQVLDAMIAQFIDSGINLKAGVRDRWEVLEAMYRQDVGSSGLPVFEKNETRATPLFKSRAKRLVDATHAALTGAQPYCQAIPYAQSQNKADEREKAVQAVVDTSRYAEYQRLAILDAAMCGLGVIWSPLTEKGVVHHHVHPGRVIVLPNISHDFGTVFCIGHMVQIPAFELMQMQEEGKIRKEFEILPSSTEFTLSDGGSDDNLSDNNSIDLPNDFQNVEVWRLLVKLNIGGEMCWWNVWYSHDQSRVMSIEKYPFKMPWYTVYRLHYEPSRFWPEVPVMQSLQAIQHQHSTLSAVMEQGAVASAVGVLAVNGTLMNGKDLKTFSPGDIIQTSGLSPNQISAIFPAINLTAVPPAIQKLEADADAALGVTKTATGQELNDATATEVQALQAAQAQTENAYASCAADGLEAHFELIDSYWVDAWETMYSVYGHKVDEQLLVKAIKIQVEWKASGRSADAGPAAQMQKLQSLFQLAQNPMSALDPMKVEERIIMELGITNHEDLLKKNQDGQTGQGPPAPMVAGQGWPQGLPAVPPGTQEAEAGGLGAMPPGPGQGYQIADGMLPPQ